ncbi:type II and III secretion system protein family protein [Marinicauda salina]|nr:type II and III secretion system protein family protein [Marinicauda salina]
MRSARQFFQTLRARCGLMLAAGALAVSGLAGAAQAQNGAPDGLEPALYNELIRLGTVQNPHVGEVVVASGKAVVLRFDQSVDEVLVGDSDVADILPLTDRSLYVLGRNTGSTSLTILNGDRHMIGSINLQVAVDLLPIKMRLHQQFPEERIEVRAVGGSVMLSGAVSDSEVSSTASEIASSYAGDRVLNTLTIRQPQQVMLAVRVAEIQRTAARSLGLSVDAFFDAGDDVDGFFSDVTNTESTSSIIGSFTEGSWSVDAVLDALEEQGVATVLAEPTLMALSGQTASFLAGGEFPVPVGTRNRDDNDVDIQIEFKEFGVRLGFTPTVLGDTINLVVEPEVSELDRQNGIEIEGIVIPGISARRATTTVELGHGQSFAIAGLISERFADQIESVPGLSRLPIIGAVGRSAAFQREETELVIIVTPYLVTPSTDAQLADPLQDFVRPNTLEMFFLGENEAGEGSSYRWMNSDRRRRDSGVDDAGYVLQ